MLERRRIDAQLERVLTRPVSVVGASEGYGKTVALQEFLTHKGVESVWVEIDAEASAAAVWRVFRQAVAGRRADLAEELVRVAASGVEPPCDQRVDEVGLRQQPQPLVVVVDNYRDSEGAQTVVKALLREAVGGLHVVLVAGQPTADASGYPTWLSAAPVLDVSSLRFSLDEIRDYCSMRGVRPSASEIASIHEESAGWPILVRLLVEARGHGDVLGASTAIQTFLEGYLSRAYGKDSRKALRVLAALGQFETPMAVQVLDELGLGSRLCGILQDMTVVEYREATHTYSVQHAIGELLRRCEPLEHEDWRRATVSAGKWLLSRGDVARAFELYLESGELECILAALETMDLADYCFNHFDVVDRVFREAETDIWKRYPLGYLRYWRARMLLGDSSVRDECSASLRTMRDYFTTADATAQKHESVLGEIYVVSTFAAFNDCDSMVEMNRRALEHLDGRISRIVTREKEITFGSPHLLYVYFRDPGTLRATVDSMVEGFGALAATSGGCGIGLDTVLYAEYALETGDIESVPFQANKAVFMARETEQPCLEVCATFALARQLVFLGNHAEARMLLNTLRSGVEAEGSAVLHAAVEMAMAYVECLAGRPEQTPTWIRQGRAQRGSLMCQGLAFDYILRGRYLVATQDFDSLDALCELFSARLGSFKNQLAVIHHGIFQSIAKAHVGQSELGRRILKTTLELAARDNIVMPFVESAPALAGMLGELDLQDDGYLGSVADMCSRYVSAAAALTSTGGVLSQREIEILKHLQGGSTQFEVASTLHISLSTVRFHLRNVYKKLGVNNKVSALNEAIRLMQI